MSIFKIVKYCAIFVNTTLQQKISQDYYLSIISLSNQTFITLFYFFLNLNHTLKRFTVFHTSWSERILAQYGHVSLFYKVNAITASQVITQTDKQQQTNSTLGVTDTLIGVAGTGLVLYNVQRNFPTAFRLRCPTGAGGPSPGVWSSFLHECNMKVA